jgi:MFS family permease
MWPIVGKGADRLAPYRMAMPALLSMVLGLLWFSFLPSTYESQLDYLLVLPGIILFGLGVGTAFPAINVGAMGSAVGPELGVASGVVNTSRQIGAAFGIAVLIAVLTTTSGWYLDGRADHIEDTAYVFAIPNPVAHGLVGENLAEFSGVIPRRSHAPVGFDRWARRQSAGIARDGFGWAFRGAALLLLLSLPFTRRLTRTPEEVRAAAMAAMAAAQAAAKAAAAGGGPAPALPGAGASAAGAGPPGGAPPDVPATAGPGTSPMIGALPASARALSVSVRIAELEDALRQLREQVGEGPNGDGDGRA